MTMSFFRRLFEPGLRTARHSFFNTPSAPRSSPTLWRQAQHHTYSPRPITSRARWQWRRTFHISTRREAYGRQPFNYQTFRGTQSLLKRWAASPTFYYQVGAITVACTGFYVYNLEKVPVSNRYRFNVVSPSNEATIGQQQYEQTMQEFGHKLLPHYSKEHRMVQRVLDRLIPHSGLEGEEWEVNVIDDEMKNAFVIPGGKVFVFRGILDVAQGEDGLAAVLGHEIAHNVAHHAAERMSQAFIFLPIGMILFAVAGVDPGIGRAAVNLAFTLPGSRAQESEADYIGLLMMAQSCYDPRAAMGLWARMEKEEQGAPPQFLSTHPSSHNRLEKIEGWLPKAQEKQELSECGGIGGYGEYRECACGLGRNVLMRSDSQ